MRGFWRRRCRELHPRLLFNHRRLHQSQTSSRNKQMNLERKSHGEKRRSRPKEPPFLRRRRRLRSVKPQKRKPQKRPRQRRRLLKKKRNVERPKQSLQRRRREPKQKPPKQNVDAWKKLRLGKRLRLKREPKQKPNAASPRRKLNVNDWRQKSARGKRRKRRGLQRLPKRRLKSALGKLPPQKRRDSG